MKIVSVDHVQLAMPEGEEEKEEEEVDDKEEEETEEKKSGKKVDLTVKKKK